MQNAPDFKIELFNAFSQPVIFLQDGKVAYANHAAAACGVDASMELAQVVLEENGSVKLRLGDLLAPATCCGYLDGTLYIADENWDGAHIFDRYAPERRAGHAHTADGCVFRVDLAFFPCSRRWRPPGSAAPWRGSTRAFISYCG